MGLTLFRAHSFLLPPVLIEWTNKPTNELPEWGRPLFVPVLFVPCHPFQTREG